MPRGGRKLGLGAMDNSYTLVSRSGEEKRRAEALTVRGALEVLELAGFVEDFELPA